MSSTTAAPLILTLALDGAAAAFFNHLRQRHFPPERNYLDAHLTLFHHLPGEHYAAIADHLSGLAAAQAPLHLQVAGVVSIGRGVAFRLESRVLLVLHQRLRQAWQAWLTPQDRQRPWPHVTVQNKVEPARARELLRELEAKFQPFSATGTGFQLWAYRDGPWEHLADIPFEAAL